MANVNELATENTPASSRKASRARRSAAAEAGSVRELPAREEKSKMTETTEQTAPKGETKTKSGRAIPERVESNNTTETQAAPAAPVEPTKLMVLAAKNPKRAGSIAHGFFQKYYGAENAVHSTVEDAFERGVRGKDLSWDRQRGHVLIGADVDAYLALTTDEERITWMKSKGFDPKMAGFIIEAPKEVAEAVQEAVEGQTAEVVEPAKA